MASTLSLLRRLTAANVDYVLVGGLAAVAHGSSSVTQDVDVCVRFDLSTMEKLLAALQGTNARERMHPARPPMRRDAADYVGYRNLYLSTDEGVLDLLGEITGVGGFDVVSSGSVRLDLGGFEVNVMGLEHLIQSKRVLARPKDLRVADELALVLSRRDTKR